MVAVAAVERVSNKLEMVFSECGSCHARQPLDVNTCPGCEKPITGDIPPLHGVSSTLPLHPPATLQHLCEEFLGKAKKNKKLASIFKDVSFDGKGSPIFVFPSRSAVEELDTLLVASRLTPAPPTTARVNTSWDGSRYLLHSFPPPPTSY